MSLVLWFHCKEQDDCFVSLVFLLMSSFLNVHTAYVRSLFIGREIAEGNAYIFMLANILDHCRFFLLLGVYTAKYNQICTEEMFRLKFLIPPLNSMIIITL